MTEVFRPNALRFGPILRGYYFSARKADEAAAGYSQVQLDASETSLDASHVFHGDATRMFKPEEAAPGFSPSGRRSGTFRWMFVSDLFHEVILRDAFPRQQARSDPRTERYRKVAFASLCGICLILSLIFVQSWWQNRNLIHNVERLGTAPTSRRGAQATLTDLRALDALRADLKELRNGGRISSHWGLYAGNRVLDAARRAYFQKFQSSLLNSANARMVQTLASAPESGQPASVHDLLKTHLMISSGRCKAEPQFVSKVLKAEARPADQDDPSLEWQTLANRQIDFYASELEYGNPCQIAEDRAACDHARKYILQSAGVEGIYRVILADAEKNVPKPSRLQDIASNYAQVLTGPADVSAAFTLEGWKFVEKASKDHGASALEPCIGEGASGSSDPRAIQQMFIRDYVDHWHKYLAGFSVIRYNGPKDAARKLDILSDHKSPLLALFSLIANQTNFPITPESNVLEKVPILGSFVKKGEKAVNKAQEFRRESPVTLTTADITRAFQPVSWVVPTTNDVLVFEKNNAYVDALAQLGHSMQDIEGKGADPGAIGATSQNAEKASEAVRQIAKGFKTLQVEGVDADVQRLLEEPIQNAKGLIPQDPGIGLVSRINGDAKALCLGLRGTLQKFPFQVTSNNDVSLTEFAGVFTPGTGSIWKFVQKSLSELIVKEGSTWKVKDPSKNPVPTPEFVDFLNRAQTVSDVFFRAGATQPQLTYILRPRPDSAPKNSTLELDVDGQSHRWTTSLQKQFSWPAAAGSTAGAVGRIRTDSLVYPFASRSGPWGIFRVLDDAEPRPVSGKLLEWKYARGSNGNPEPIEPPVRLDIVEFPGGVDVFNPKFLQQLKCPMTAVQAAPK